MKNQNFEQEDRQKAKLKVEFKIHLATYMVVNTLLTIINYTLTPESIWYIWPLMGWGIGVIIHAFKTYYSTNSSLKERMIEKEMEKQNFYD